MNKMTAQEASFWDYCSNKESPNHYEAIENIEECSDFHLEYETIKETKMTEQAKQKAKGLWEAK